MLTLFSVVAACKSALHGKARTNRPSYRFAAQKRDPRPFDRCYLPLFDLPAFKPKAALLALSRIFFRMHQSRRMRNRAGRFVAPLSTVHHDPELVWGESSRIVRGEN